MGGRMAAFGGVGWRLTRPCAFIADGNLHPISNRLMPLGAMMKKQLALLFSILFGAALHAQTINNLGAGSTIKSTDIFPAYQGANPATGVTAAQIQAFTANATPYLGITATRGRLATNNIGAGLTWVMAQTMHWSRDTIINPSIVYGNFWVSTGTESSRGTLGTIGASICIGNATICNSGSNYTLCGASHTNPFPDDALTAVACPGITIPNNTQFFVRSLENNSGGANYSQVNAQSVPAGNTYDCWANGTGAPTDQLLTGTIGTAGPGGNCGVFDLWPIGIVSQTVRPGLVLIGDSRIQCGVDYPTDVTSDCGDIARSLGPSFGYSNFGISGSLLTTILAGTHTQRDLFVNTYASHVIDEYCVNDLNGGSRTAAQCATDRASMAALYPNVVTIGTTIPIETNSTDNFVTTTNQSAANVQNITFNQIVRDGGIAGERGYYDLAWAIDPSHTNVWPPSLNPFAASLSPVFSGTGSISTANPSILTVTACTTCTLTIGTNIVGTNVAPGTYIIAYGTNVSGAGVCTATCTYTVNPVLASTVTSTAITAAGGLVMDGLHLTPIGEGFLKATGVVSPYIIRR